MVPFLGVSEAVFPLCIVSPWLQNGNILDYVRKNQGANRLKLVSDLLQSLQPNSFKRTPQLAQAARGLEHLHSLSIVHSDIIPVRAERSNAECVTVRHVLMLRSL